MGDMSHAKATCGAYATHVVSQYTAFSERTSSANVMEGVLRMAAATRMVACGFPLQNLGLTARCRGGGEWDLVVGSSSVDPDPTAQALGQIEQNFQLGKGRPELILPPPPA